MAPNIDELVRRVESLPDAEARAVAVELAQALMSLHADALGRILEIVSASKDGGSAVAAMTGDDLISSVLALHGLHPDDFDARIARAMDRLQLFFDSRGSGITLVEASVGRVRVRFTGSRPGSGSAATQVIESVLYEAAPEIEELIIEGAEEPRVSGFVPLSDLTAAQSV